MRRRSRTTRAHPRSRGAAGVVFTARSRALGPSPLTRGSQATQPSQQRSPGPIPAHAGQPPSSPAPDRAGRAHPRSRGAAHAGPLLSRGVRGPSPLTRGSLVLRQEPRRNLGPIPAHAGQPRFRARRTRTARAHPRSRGAAWCQHRPSPPRSGPSPLTRGSPRPSFRCLRPSGPIPAHAGQPTVDKSTGGCPGAHPRSRGAAALLRRAWHHSQGPSPLTRGSHPPPTPTGRRRGPIPAHAGQPGPPGRLRAWTRAHPRSRGAAGYVLLSLSAPAGPSPLTRGSLFGPTHCQQSLC